mgnify:CR=1 FL=1
MCGIFGCIHNPDYNFQDEQFKSLVRKIEHRGPDNLGFSSHYINNKLVKLGHARLSIIDLNETGHQPMHSDSGKYSIIFNGEIYNHLDIRKYLDSKYQIGWRGTSDTETLLNLLEREDLKKSLNRLEGMFSFVLLDHSKEEIIISRDHSGEKPLYLSCSKDYFGFASDLNPLKGIPGFINSINRKSVENFLQYNYIPSPDSIYESSFKLPPASCLILDLKEFKLNSFSSFEGLIRSKGVQFFNWWSLKNNLDLKGKSDSFNDSEVEEQITNLLKSSVKSQLISDVPLGAFLSGGIDSSLVAALMQEINGNTRTYTIGFDFAEFDESVYAKKVSDHLGTNHTTYTCGENDFFDLIEHLPSVFSEPFADSSQLPTMLVSKLARKDVKVALSGDAGDEVFGGYNRYLIANKYWKLIKHIPPSLTKFLIKSTSLLPKKSTALLSNFLPHKFSGSKSDRLEKALKKISYIHDKNSFYSSMTKEWTSSDQIMEFTNESNLTYEDLFNSENLTFEEAMMHADFLSYLPDDILCKVDRSSMYYSLETRAPFLNKELLEYAYKLPLEYKIRNGKSKWILRKILNKYVPPELIERPKQGFGIPVSKWMRSELKPWVNDMLSPEVLKKHNLFNEKVVNDLKNSHFNGSVNNEHKMWSLIQFNQWYLDNHN